MVKYKRLWESLGMVGAIALGHVLVEGVIIAYKNHNIDPSYAKPMDLEIISSDADGDGFKETHLEYSFPDGSKKKMELSLENLEKLLK